jgi:type I restriction enzyme M protein
MALPSDETGVGSPSLATAGIARGRQVQDYISGELVRDSAEERVTQIVAKWLVEEMGYEKSQIQTRPQWKVPKSPGSARSSGWPCDLVIFDAPEGQGRAERATSIFEIKAPNKLATAREMEHTERELKQYVEREPAARLAVLSNGIGDDAVMRVFYKFYKDGDIEWRELRAFPRAGEEPDLGTRTLKRKDLFRAPNLKSLFRDIRNYIHSSDTRVSRDEEIIREIVSLLLCKIYDEDRGPNEPLEFYWSVDDTDEEVAERLNRIYRKVREDYAEVFDERDSDEIRLDPSSIRYAVAKLQRFELTNSDRHAIGDAFEVFIGDALKGKEGQYFTPRNVIQTMVKFLDPKPDDSFIDPACGTGGFLASALDHVYRQIETQLLAEGREAQIGRKKHDWANKKLRGIDKEALNIKFSKAEVALLGNGHQGLFRQDSLNYDQWPAEMKRRIKLGTFDVVMTNPPFGSKLKRRCDEMPLDYDLTWEFRKDHATSEWHKTSKRRNEQEIGILFLELCLKLLRPGGKLGIVFSEGHLATLGDEYISSWLLRQGQVLGILDLPDSTFQPHTHAKTCVLFVEKNETPPREYPILMAQAKRIGHDDRGNPIYRYGADYQPIRGEDGHRVRDDDLQFVDDQLARLQAGHDEENQFGFRWPVTELENNVLIPRYYDRSYLAKLERYAAENDCDLVRIADLEAAGVLGAYRGHGGMKKQWYDENGPIPYIRTSNVSGLEIEYHSNHVRRLSEALYEKRSLKRGSVRIKADDILFVRRGEDRIGDVAIVYEGFERILCANEIDIVRIHEADNEYGISPFLLLYLLAHPQVRAQYEHKTFYETIIWNVGDRWRQVLLPIPRNADVRQTIHDRVHSVVEKRRAGLLEIRDLWERPVLPYSDEPELVPALDAVSDDGLQAAIGEG